MSDSDTSQLIGAIMQLQMLHRKGRFAIPLRVKWLPSQLRGSAMAQDVSELFVHLQPLLKVNLNRVSRGDPLPADTAGHVYAFYRSLVQLRLAVEAAKSERAEEVLVALAEELDAVEASSTATNDEGLSADLANPHWVRWYRVVAPDDDRQWQAARRAAQFLAKREAGSVDTNALALMTFLARDGSGDSARPLLDRLVETGLDFPQRWTLLFSDAMRECLVQHYDAAAQRRLVQSWIALLTTTTDREAELRGELLETMFRELPRPDELFQAVVGLGDLVVKAGAISGEVLLALRTRGVKQVLALLECMRPDAATVTTPDAQFLIGRLLQAHDIAGQTPFLRFCRRIAHVELTAGLRSSLNERVLNNSKMKQALINQAWSPDELHRQLKAATDYHAELFHLVLLAMQYFEGPVLGEVTRALSLIDVAIRQNKIDPRHLSLLIRDLKRDPRENLLALTDEERIDAKAQGDPELFLMYLNLRILAQTSDRVEAEDLEHLSGTLRKLKMRDARGQQP